MTDQDKKAKASKSDIAVTTESGILTKECYTAEDLSQFDPETLLGRPGAYPFTRGVHANMYRGKLWTMRQYAGFGTAEESNARYKFLLSQGQTGLSVALDLPTQMGYDSDDPLVEDEVGRVGVAIDTLEDMENLFDGIPLDKISTNFTINSTASIILAMYIALAEKRGHSLDQISGTTQNDMIKEFLARKTYVFPVEPSLRIVADMIEYCSRHLPHFNPIGTSGYHIRELGADAVQELAFTLGAAITYVEEVLKRGIDVDEFAPHLAFQLWTGPDIFEEVAKYRAARRMWARIAKARFGAKNPRSMMLRVFAGGNGITLTAKEPLNNIVRVAMQCLTAALAGAQAIHTPAYDEAFAIPTVESARMALRTQQVIAYETGVARVADPLGGSYYLETLTNELERRAEELLDEIDRRGGMVAAIKSGFIQTQVQNRAYQVEKEIQAGQRAVVGVNRFASEDGGEESLQIQEISPAIVQKQVANLRRVKEKRDGARVRRALERLEQAAAGNENLMPHVIEAVKAYATVGEITASLKKVYGEYQETVIF